ncbi:MAG: hypothetical protein GX879_05355 [Bacteroidales bacterium]|nr:hypothetical protein [Bacteroidales bacterium]
MSFLFPIFFWGLLAVAIPILIHLFHFRRFKTVYFSNTMMLHHLQKENKTKTKLKHWLILLMRILMIIALVFAFTQPFIPSSTSSSSAKKNIVAIYLDNSFSMLGETEKGRKLDVGREYAYEISSSFAADMQFFLITNDFLPAHQRVLNQNEIKQELADIQISSYSRNVEDIILKANNLVGNMTNLSLYLISDCQASDFKLDNFPEFAHNVFLVPVSSGQPSNISIDSCWFENPVKVPGKQEEMKIKLTNHSNQAAINVPIKLFINDTLKSFLEVNIDADLSETVVANYTEGSAGEVKGWIETEDYPVVFDNKLFFNYELSDEIDILHIYENNLGEKYLSAIYGLDGDNMNYFANRSGTEVNSEFNSYKLIVCDGLKTLSSGLIANLNDFMNSGGGLMIVAGKDVDIQSYRSFLDEVSLGRIADAENKKNRLSNVNYNHYLFKDVFSKIEQSPDLPDYLIAYPLQVYAKSGADIALTDNTGKALVVSKPFGAGKLIYCALPISVDNESFMTHPIFLPLFYNAALYSGSSGNLYYTIGETSSLDIGNIEINNREVFHVKDSFVDIIPEYKIIPGGIRLNVPSEINHCGHFQLTYGDDKIGLLSLNYSREESEQEYLSENQCLESFKDAGITNIKSISPDSGNLKTKVLAESIGVMLWKYFLIAALIFILFEILITRFMK